MDFRNRASSNFSPNIVSETGSTGFVEVLLRLQTEAAGMISFWISVVPPRMDRTLNIGGSPGHHCDQDDAD